MSRTMWKLAVPGFLFVVLSLLLTGCWDEQSIEERALVLGLAIDEVQDTNTKAELKTTHLDNQPGQHMLHITAQIAVPGRVPLGPGSEGGGDSGNPVWVVSADGHSLDDCLNNLQQKLAEPRYLIHLRIIVISEDFARHGLDEINDYLRRNPEVRRRTWLLVTGQKAENFMKVQPPLQRVPTLYILSMMDRAVDSGKFPQDFIGDFWSAESKWGRDGFLPYVSIRNKENITIDGLAYFSKGKLAGTTQPLDIGAYMAFQGIDPGGYSVLFKTGKYGDVMSRTISRHSRKRTVIRNGKPHVICDIDLEGDLDEHYHASKAISTSADLHALEKEFEQDTEQILRLLFEQTQQDRSDIFGIGECVRAHHQSYWKKNVHSKWDWEELYPTVSVELRIRLTIRRVGLKDT
ncbi:MULTISPECIES: Ger(x)C family spore germination protein [Paenibacillus]|uniref:Ger(x)C family spore germination protein n=1 Tax=Paenibacillus TaxID=44249 RepID=UPI001F1917CD|nr:MULTISPECIES: Ger(x)C family spore germination protein [Paenibacillus]